MKVRFIKQKLEAMGKTPEWLANQCGVSPVVMKTLILRGATPRKPTLLLMAHNLGCQLTDIVYPEEFEDKVGPSPA